MARIVTRPVVTLSGAAQIPDSQTIRQRMPLGATIQSYHIRFTGTLTVGVAAATVLEDSPLGYLRSIDLMIGGFPLRVHDARAARVLNTLQYGSAPRLTAPSGAVGATAFSAELTIDLWQPDLRMALGLDRAFWLDTRFYSQVELVFTTGVAADVATAGGGGTVTLSNLVIQITAEEVLDQGGLLSRVQITRQIVQTIAATGILDLQPFTGGGVIYRGWLLHFTSGNADPNRATSDDTILTDVSLVDSRGIRIIDAVAYEQLRGENKRVYGIETMPAGWVLLDRAKAHHLGDLWATRGAQNVSMRLNIGAAPANSIVQVYPLVLMQRQPRGQRERWENR